MLNTIPCTSSILFGITVLLTVFAFFQSTGYSVKVLLVLLTWILLQTGISLSGFYTNSMSLPPRFVLAVGPAVLFIIGLFAYNKGRLFIDGLSTAHLTLLHTIRIPVEIVLFLLFTHKAVPQLMTFEGQNFDILSGITAPFVYYFGYHKKTLPKNILLIWNFICLGLLANIVITAVLSAPMPIQQFAFDQPNIAVLYFPFVLLPACIVPIVLFAHLATIRQLFRQKD